MKSFCFISSFGRNLKKNTGIIPNKDNLAYIKMMLQNSDPYTKYDEKGRHSSYYTFILEEKLITVVVDADTNKVLTAVIETHRRGWNGN